MQRLLLSLGLAISLTACGASPAVTPTSGIQGTVEVGPTCPVERLNSPCPPRPIAATVVVRSSAGSEVTRFQSDANGQFKVSLAPGTYTLVGLPVGSGFLPRPIPSTATVVAGSYTTVNVEYDSGIR